MLIAIPPASRTGSDSFGGVGRRVHRRNSTLVHSPPHMLHQETLTFRDLNEAPLLQELPPPGICGPGHGPTLSPRRSVHRLFPHRTPSGEAVTSFWPLPGHAQFHTTHDRLLRQRCLGSPGQKRSHLRQSSTARPRPSPFLLSFPTDKAPAWSHARQPSHRQLPWGCSPKIRASRRHY